MLTPDQHPRQISGMPDAYVLLLVLVLPFGPPSHANSWSVVQASTEPLPKGHMQVYSVGLGYHTDHAMPFWSCLYYAHAWTLWAGAST